jgi:Trypsin-like serine proteases, typically periplasmic, contain C-terminal PDZ domain
MAEAMRSTLISLATCLLISPAVVAQDTPAQPKVIPPGVIRVEGDVRPVFQVLTSRRARLGISVNLRARDTDSIGALVSSVTPNGPAAKAGLRSGDVITKLAGSSLLDGQARASNDDSAPGLRLTELAARLDPNDTIGVEFRRGKERKTVSLITGDEPTIMWRTPDGGFGYSMGGDESFRQFQDAMRGFDPEDSQPRYPMRMIHPDAPMRFAFGSPLADLELAPLNPDLGRYFGTSEGILVISVPADSKLGLRGGDVVLAVDGREPANASHLLRILRSYEGSESFKLDIMRDKKRMTVVGKIGAP